MEIRRRTEAKGLIVSTAKDEKAESVYENYYEFSEPVSKIAGKDRHARIGEGQIGKAALIRVVCHPLLKHLPFYLETPNELDGYATEIQLMRQASVAMGE